MGKFRNFPNWKIKKFQTFLNFENHQTFIIDDPQKLTKNNQISEILKLIINFGISIVLQIVKF